MDNIERVNEDINQTFIEQGEETDGCKLNSYPHERSAINHVVFLFFAL